MFSLLLRTVVARLSFPFSDPQRRFHGPSNSVTKSPFPVFASCDEIGVVATQAVLRQKQVSDNPETSAGEPQIGEAALILFVNCASARIAARGSSAKC